MRAPTDADVTALVADLQITGGFLIGTASAAYQVEGGFNGPGEPRNNWAEFEKRKGLDPTGLATRFWHEPARDFGLARGMNLNAHRLGIEWARVQPTGPDAWDEVAVARYVAMLRDARAHGLEPVVTLHHFTHPEWAGADFWLDSRAPERFGAYVTGIVQRLNDGLRALGDAPIRWWITINEPNALAMVTYIFGVMPRGSTPGLPLSRCLRAFDGLYTGHVVAYGAIHRLYAAQQLPSPTVTINNFAMDTYGLDRLFIDLLLSRSRGVTASQLADEAKRRQRQWEVDLAPLAARSKSSLRRGLASVLRWVSGLIFMPHRFPKLRAALEASEFPRPLDAIAIDYYDAALANQLRFLSGKYDPWSWEIDAEGLFHILRANAGDGLPLLIAENGMATRRAVGGLPEIRTDSRTRDVFLRAHLFETLRAMKAGVNVVGYLHWSLTDNYEWGRFSPRFGLFGVEYEHPDRPRLATDASGVDAAATFGRLAEAIRSGKPGAIATALLGGK